MRMHDCLVRARAAGRAGQARVAAEMVRSGLRQFGSYQASFGSIDLQTAGRGARPATRRTGRRARARRAAVLRPRSSRPPNMPAQRPVACCPCAHLLMSNRRNCWPNCGRRWSRSAVPCRGVTPNRCSPSAAIWSVRSPRTDGAWPGPATCSRSRRVAEISDQLDANDTTMVVLVEAQGQLHAVVVDAGTMRLHALGPAAPTVENVRRVRADLDVLSRPHLVDAMRDRGPRVVRGVDGSAGRDSARPVARGRQAAGHHLGRAVRPPAVGRPALAARRTRRGRAVRDRLAGRARSRPRPPSTA